MEPETTRIGEETLDPQDWDALRALGHRMVDDVITFLQTVRERPVWQPAPEPVKARLRLPLPREPQGAEAAYQDFLETVLPYPMGNIHPRFWGWVIGTGEPFGALAEMLAAAVNPNLGGGNHVANAVEEQVLDWCKEMVGFPAEASGLLVSGGSMANLVALAVARTAMARRKGFDVRTDGLRDSPRKMVLYASRETHSSVQKAVELMGLGSSALRLVPVDARFRIDLAALKGMIAADRDEEDLWPFCVVGNAGTVNTGAIDDLPALADLCEQEGLWFHVDGAFGALAALSPELAPRVAGMEQADSLAFDMHKWMGMPFEIACVLVRAEEDHRRAFSLTPEYLAHADRGLGAGNHWYSDYGIQLSRGFRALKAWLMIKEHGIEKFGRVIRQNVAQAAYLGEQVAQHPHLEQLAPVSLNLVCFRYRASGLDDEALNAINQEILFRLHESGLAAPSSTTLDGKYAIRVANVNHRSRREDFDLLVAEVVKIGDHLIRS